MNICRFIRNKNNHPVCVAFKRTSIPFFCGVIFFLLVSGPTFFVNWILDTNYALLNRALGVADFDTFGYVAFAALLGETLFGWENNRKPDYITSFATTLRENCYFLAGVGCGLCVFFLIFSSIAADPSHKAEAIALAVYVTPMSYLVSVAYEYLRNLIRKECGGWSTALFAVFSIMMLVCLWWAE